MERQIKVWFDGEGDYLEVLFERKAGHFRETSNDAVMEKIDENGNVIGFSIFEQTRCFFHFCIFTFKEREIETV